ncbi:MAG: aminotransferase class IV [Pseudomonadales bacterium]|jgi:D-alanine transaminase|nr:aminotransferase class IV [Pseudomonadales bacterium]MDP7359707.1 aminotransferase class IV [Pseudomonadales bacterium]MDP7594270.1 aminotransferase class IV [Pseudomonadales bacterium]HJN50610.1 aminotransferase class IV [Pseudomonadales bacterium]|tara:strand:+ start:585 stop:1430 length:846 start_codon:yes stop_codon:yes gene_type:complete
MIAYLNDQFLSLDSLSISPDDRGFLFADGVYEVVLLVKQVPFHLDDHLARLDRNLQAIQIAAPEGLQSICGKLVELNQPASDFSTLYIQITRGVAPRNHRFPDQSVKPTVYAKLSPIARSEAEVTGAKVILTEDIRWGRCDIKTTNLLANVMAVEQAKNAGADEAVFVRDGLITEGAHTNFAAVFDGTLYTHPLDHQILPGITRDIVMGLCRELGFAVRETAVSAEDLAAAEECMLFGTTKIITPVVQVDDRLIANGKPGRITRTLQQSFQQLLERVEDRR